MNTRLVKVLSVILSVVTVLLCFTSCGLGGKIDIEDYVTVEYTGFDGKGSVDFDIDYDELTLALLDKCKSQIKKMIKENESEYSVDEFAYLMASAFNVYTEAEDLSNGQVITAEIDFEGHKYLFEEYGFNIDLSPISYTVEGLQEPVSVDVFENMEVVFEGISPKLRVSFKEKEVGKYGFSVTYKLNTSGYYNNFKIGDNLNIVAQFSEGSAIDKGYIVTSTEKTITIDNTMAESYIQDPNQISADIKTLAKAEADKKAQQQFTNQNSSIDIDGTYITLAEAESVSEITQEKTYLVYSDDPGLGVNFYEDAYNFICVVYKFRVNNANESFVWEDAPEFHYDGYAYGYIYIPNITIKNGTVKYDLTQIGSNNNAFTSVEALESYLASHNYTCIEMQ